MCPSHRWTRWLPAGKGTGKYAGYNISGYDSRYHGRRRRRRSGHTHRAGEHYIFHHGAGLGWVSCDYCAPGSSAAAAVVAANGSRNQRIRRSRSGRPEECWLPSPIRLRRSYSVRAFVRAWLHARPGRMKLRDTHTLIRRGIGRGGWHGDVRNSDHNKRGRYCRSPCAARCGIVCIDRTGNPGPSGRRATGGGWSCIVHLGDSSAVVYWLESLRIESSHFTFWLESCVL